MTPGTLHPLEEGLAAAHAPEEASGLPREPQGRQGEGFCLRTFGGSKSHRCEWNIVTSWNRYSIWYTFTCVFAFVIKDDWSGWTMYRQPNLRVLAWTWQARTQSTQVYASHFLWQVCTCALDWFSCSAWQLFWALALTFVLSWVMGWWVVTAEKGCARQRYSLSTVYDSDDIVYIILCIILMQYMLSCPELETRPFAARRSIQGELTVKEKLRLLSAAMADYDNQAILGWCGTRGEIRGEVWIRCNISHKQLLMRAYTRYNWLDHVTIVTIDNILPNSWRKLAQLHLNHVGV